MAKSDANETGIGFEDTLWAAADKLRGTVDAAEYKPSEDVFTAFDWMIGPVFEKAFANTLESQSLAGMRDYLLPKLLSGELRVAEGSVCSILETTAASRKRQRRHA